MVELGQELPLNDRPHLCLFADVGDFSGTIKKVNPLARGSYLLDVKEEAYTHTQGVWWRGSIRMMTALIVYNLPPSRSALTIVKLVITVVQSVLTVVPSQLGLN